MDGINEIIGSENGCGSLKLIEFIMKIDYEINWPKFLSAMPTLDDSMNCNLINNILK